MRHQLIEALEVSCAVFVTAGLVAGNLLLFSPLRTDNRVEPSRTTAEKELSALIEQD